LQIELWSKLVVVFYWSCTFVSCSVPFVVFKMYWSASSLDEKTKLISVIGFLWRNSYCSFAKTNHWIQRGLLEWWV